MSSDDENRDQLVAQIEDTIWSALGEQHEQDMGPFVHRESAMIDATGSGVDMRAVAVAVADMLDDREHRLTMDLKTLFAADEGLDTLLENLREHPTPTDALAQRMFKVSGGMTFEVNSAMNSLILATALQRLAHA